MTTTEFIELAKKKGFKNTEIVKSKQKNVSLAYLNGALDEYEIAEQINYVIKVEHLGKVVVASNSELKEELIEQLEWQAIHKENEDSDYFTNDTSNNNTYTTSLKVSSKEEIERLKKLSEVPKKYPQIYRTALFYFEKISEVGYYNSNGVSLESGNHTYKFIVNLSSQEGEERASEYAYLYDINKNEWNLEEFIENACLVVCQKLKAHSIPSGNYPVIIENKIMNKILGKYITMFSAELIQKKRSPLEGKLNQSIFSNLITIKEEPNRKDLCGYRSFDNEGTKTKDMVLVENGVLKEILYNNKTALKDNTESTGNEYYGIRPRNCYIEPGEKSFEELKQSHDKLIVITDISGLHVGVNLTSGDFSLQAGGYLVENGKRVEELKLIVLTDNIFTMLKNVETVGNDLIFLSDAVGSPSVLVKEMQISGMKDISKEG